MEHAKPRGFRCGFHPLKEVQNLLPLRALVAASAELGPECNLGRAAKKLWRWKYWVVVVNNG